MVWRDLRRVRERHRRAGLGPDTRRAHAVVVGPIDLPVRRRDGEGRDGPELNGRGVGDAPGPFARDRGRRRRLARRHGAADLERPDRPVVRQRDELLAAALVGHRRCGTRPGPAAQPKLPGLKPPQLVAGLRIVGVKHAVGLGVKHQAPRRRQRAAAALALGIGQALLPRDLRGPGVDARRALRIASDPEDASAG